jgi:hypothetical protein
LAVCEVAVAVVLNESSFLRRQLLYTQDLDQKGSRGTSIVVLLAAITHPRTTRTQNIEVTADGLFRFQ